MSIVFYDGLCGVCRREIAHYKKIAPPQSFIWQDISLLSAEDLAKHGISRATALRSLHIKTPDGEMHRGIDAFLLIWQELRRWRILGFLIRLPGLYHLASFMYHRISLWRFKRLDHCQLAAQEEKKTL